MNVPYSGEPQSADTVCRVRDTMPDARELSRAAELFKACGDTTRAGIICALIELELCVCDLAEVLGMTSSAISHQLRVLKHMGIVKTRRSGKSMFYSLSDGHIERIFSTAFEHIREGAKHNGG